MRSAIIIILAFFAAACSSKSEKRPVNRPNKNNHDWTGTYEFKDSNNTHTLKLHRRSVDLSYEMTYVNHQITSKNNIWSVKDLNDSIRIIFINNFVDDPSTVPFQRGDILFSLILQPDSSIQTNWQKIQPPSQGSFLKISNNFN